MILLLRLCHPGVPAPAGVCGRPTGFADVGVTPSDITPWNVYPWYINAAPKPAQLDLGMEPLVQLMDLMPALRAVFLPGNDAQRGWARVVKRYPARPRQVTVIATFRPGRQALFHPDPAVRQARTGHQEASYRELGEALG